MINGWFLWDITKNELVVSFGVAVEISNEILIERIKNIAEQVGDRYIAEFDIGRYRVYVRRFADVIVGILTDASDPFVYEVIERFIDQAYKLEVHKKGISDKEYVKKALDNILNEIPPSFNTLKEIARWLLEIIPSGLKSVELGIENLVPKKEKPKKIEIKMKHIVGKVDTETLVDLYLEGNMEETLRKSQRALYESDWHRALFVKSALRIQNSDYRKTTIPIDQIYSVALSIDDDFIREYLLSEIEGFFGFGSDRNKKKLVYSKLQELTNSLEGESKILYAILLDSAMSRPIINKVKNIIEQTKKAEWLTYELEVRYLISELLLGNWSTFSNWNEKLSDLPKQLEKYKADKRIQLAIITMVLLYVIVAPLFTSVINELKSIFRRALAMIDYYRRHVEGRDLDVINDIKAIFLTLVSKIIELACIFLGAEDRKTIADKYSGWILKNIRWLWTQADNIRIVRDYYIIALTALIRIYVYLAKIRGYITIDLPRIILNTDSKELISLFGYDEMIYGISIGYLLVAMGLLVPKAIKYPYLAKKYIQGITWLIIRTARSIRELGAMRLYLLICVGALRNMLDKKALGDILSEFRELLGDRFSWFMSVAQHYIETLASS